MLVAFQGYQVSEILQLQHQLPSPSLLKRQDGLLTHEQQNTTAK